MHCAVSMLRREFFGTPLAAAGATGAAAAAPSDSVAIETPYLRLAYSLEEGRFTLSGRKGSPVLVNAAAAAVFPRGEALTCDANYRRTARAGFPDAAAIKANTSPSTARTQTARSTWNPASRS